MGSSKKATVGYRYYMGLHFGLCHGPVDALHQVSVGEREAWSGNITSNGSIAIDSPNLFGGDEREGGISGQLDVLMGSAAQMENDYLVSKIGAAIPAFRGILSAVWRGGQVSSNNPYVKPWAFRVKRILQGWSTGSAWYPEKASPSSTECGATTTTGLYYVAAGSAYHNVSHAGYGLPNGYSIVPADYTAAIDVIGANCINARNAATGSSYTYAGSSVYINNSYLYVSAYSTQLGSTVGISAVRVEPLCESGYSPSFYYDDVAQEVVVYCAKNGTKTTDMNPAHIIYQCLTNTAWGMGYPTTAIDNTSFTAAADALYSEGFGLSMLWNRQETIENFVALVLDHIGGMLYVRPDTSTFGLKLIRSDYDRATLPQYGVTNLISAENYQRQAWAETINEITVVYTDACSGKEAATTVQDQANIITQGGIVAQTRQYPGITSTSLAQRVALRDLQSVSTPLARIKLTATRVAWELFPGGLFRLSWPEYDIDDVVYRVLDVNRGTLQNGEIVIDAVEDVFGLPDNTYLADQPGEWVDPSSDPVAAPYRKLLEAPYWDLARNLSPADLAYVDALAGYLETLAVRPSGDATNYGIQARVGAAAYAAVGNGDFCPSATIVAALSKTTTAVTLANGVDLDLVESGSYAVIDNEYVLVSAIDSLAGTATLSRGVLDTVPADHAAGARIWFADGWQGIDPTEYADGEAVDVKLLPVTGRGSLPIGSAPVNSLTIDQRQYRPYAPGKLQINAGVYPDWIDGAADLALTWAHRDRLLQTAYLVEQSEASIGPEAGTTYTIRVYGETDSLIKTYSGLSGTSQTYPKVDEEADSAILGYGGSYTVTWSVQTSGFVSAPIYSIGYDGSGLMAIGGGSGSPKIHTSTDGVTWTPRTSNLHASSNCWGVAHDGSGLWVAVSDGATANLSSSPDGITWTARTSGVVYLRCVAYGAGKWYAAGDSGGLTKSTNGTSWATETSGFSTTRIWGIAYGGGMWVAVGESGKLGANGGGGWGQYTSSFGTTRIRCVAYGDGLWVAGGDSGKLATSTDGVTWSQVSGGFGTAQIESVAYDDTVGAFVIGTSDGVFAGSFDGQTWTDYTSGFSGSAIYAVKRCGTLLVEAGASGKLSTSPGLVAAGYRLNGRLRVEVESMRGGLTSYQKHDHTVLREGYGFNYGYYYGGQ